MSRILPILFNTEMTKAILDGRKTVTRRICKDGDDYTVPDMGFYNADKRTYAVHNYADNEHKKKMSIAERTCPICPGDILYVRETFFCEDCAPDCTGRNDEDECPFNRVGDSCYGYKTQYIDSTGRIKWKPSIHMPKEAARIWIKVTDVRAERMRDMTIGDMIREGIDTTGIITTNGPIPYRVVNRFEELWDSTVKEDWQKFASNPWVWVYEFERCEKPD